ncbi:LysR family transcriptional regulator [Novosphingobium profundi]|uniref:LysR family transcriptional regulator n=1 Tax=Novosphingobium profundi TaxID=1774954 RepID=UPI001BDAA294|nr:LysR family transcriptional regulator [Novosphingobium profundi]MBT0670107.1 LysR family transcriptional regulator [Novosphingobium profundi]
MNISSIDIRQLRYFVAVVRHGSFRSAAQAIHISQPPLTRQIQQLEHAIGTELLIRRNRGVEPTTAGAAFFRDAENILETLERAAHRAKLTGEGQMGRLDVGIFGSAVLDTVPRIIKAFREIYPKVEIILHDMDRETQLEALRDGRIAVGLNRFFEREPGLEWETLHSEEMMLAVPSAHPLAAKSAICFPDLDGEPVIFYPRVQRPSGFTRYLMRLFHEREMVPNVVQSVDNAVTAVALASSGLGLCFVVEGAQNLQLPGVVYRRFKPEEKLSSDLSIIWRSDDDSPLVEAFLDVARKCDMRTAVEPA